MGQTRFNSTIVAQSGLKVGSASAPGTELTRVLKGSVTVDLASVSANSVADASITVAGAAAGDICIVQPPTAALTAGLVICQAHVSAADTVTVRVQNTTGSPIDQASGSWNYVLIKS